MAQRKKRWEARRGLWVVASCKRAVVWANLRVCTRSQGEKTRHSLGCKVPSVSQSPSPVGTPAVACEEDVTPSRTNGLRDVRLVESWVSS
jgi:hypothetical protein